jgi:hypothetical protein
MTDTLEPSRKVKHLRQELYNKDKRQIEYMDDKVVREVK